MTLSTRQGDIRMGRYCWIVTKDNVTTPSDHGDGLPSRLGWIGPRDTTREEADKARTEGRPWRTRCDEPDEKPCYYGTIWFEDDEPGEEMFGPLDDLGRPDTGCVTIEYKDKDGKWIAL